MGKSNRNKLIIATAAVFLIFIVVPVGIFLLTKEESSSVATIESLDKELSSVSKERRDEIVKSLKGIVSRNNEDLDVDKININDAVIRKDSMVKNLSENKIDEKGSFIVDLEDIRQSYKVQYTYSRNPNSNFGQGYPVMSSCLPIDELIYGDFDCKDTVTGGVSTDPFLSKLPYNATYYSITNPLDDKDGKPLVVIKIKLIARGERPMQSFKQYQSQAMEWISGNGGNINEYTVEWHDSSGRVIEKGTPAN